METKHCYDCEASLTPESTKEFEGFDSGNYHAAHSVGLSISADYFTKCDDCFYADIDRALESQYS